MEIISCSRRKYRKKSNTKR